MRIENLYDSSLWTSVVSSSPLEETTSIATCNRCGVNMTGAAGSTVTLTGTTEVVGQLCGLLESDISRRSISTSTACGVDSLMMSTMPQTASNFNACAGSADCHSPTTRGSGAHFGRMPHVSFFDDRCSSRMEHIFVCASWNARNWFSNSVFCWTSRCVHWFPK